MAEPSAAAVREVMSLLRDAHAFSGGRVGSELPARHVPFDQLTGRHLFEEAIAREWRTGSTVVVRGESGTGKSSVVEFVLGEGEEEFLPIRMRLGQRREVGAVTEPADFARELARVITRMAQDVTGQTRMGVEQAARSQDRGRRDRAGISFNLGLIRIDLATEVEKVARVQGELDDVDRALTLLDVLREDGRHVVLVLDDLDQFFASEIQGEEAATIRAAFMKRIVRFLPELRTAVVIAAQPRHTEGGAWRDAQDFVNLVVDIPGLPDVAAVRRILERRIEVSLGTVAEASPPTTPGGGRHANRPSGDRHATPPSGGRHATPPSGDRPSISPREWLDAIFEPAALEELFRVSRNSSNRMRNMLTAADRALGLTVDEGGARVSEGAVRAAAAVL